MPFDTHVACSLCMLSSAAAMLAARILRAAGKIAAKVAPAGAVTMHAVPNGVPPAAAPPPPPPQHQQQQYQQANGHAVSVSAMG